MAADGNYQILNLVATGGTAVLYRAIQKSLDRVVAVKKLHQHLTEDENFTRRFVLEAKAAASLDHDNIVKIIDFGVGEDSYHIVMEFIEGESLREVIDKWKRLEVNSALAVVYQVCQGLEHAHKKGIVHRDIKPGNVMLTNRGRVKITDFGLAKLTQSTTQHTAANSILGTPLYMSPEQAFGESVDQRSDIFSLGTMLYEMITGVQPFKDENYMGVIQNILKRNAPHPSRFQIDVPGPVQSMISRAMNKSRDARYQSADAFRRAIEKYLGLERLKESTDNLTQLLSNDGSTVIMPRTLHERRSGHRFRKGIVAAFVATALVAATGLGWHVAPPAIRARLHGLVLRTERSQTPPARTQRAGVDGIGAGPFLSSEFPDTMTNAATSVDSSLVATHATRPLPAPAAAVPVDTDSPAAQPASPPSAHPGASTAATETTREDTVRAEPVAAPTSPPATAPGKIVKKPSPPRVRTGWISVSAEPRAGIYIDGRYKGETPPAKRIELPRGRHELECRNPHYHTYREMFQITSGELSRRRIVLEKRVGRISFSITAGAQVFIDGKLLGVTPLKAPADVDAGKHLVTVKKPGFNVWNNEITVGAGETLSLKITLSPMY